MAQMQYKALVLDVDGTMTDGGIYLDDHGNQLKRFDATDGSGVKYFQRAGGVVAFLTGRQSRAVQHRAAELGVTFVRQGVFEKESALMELCGQMGVRAAQVAYMGDDLVDVPAMRAAGYSIAPANAAEPVRQFADFVTTRPGGAGAVREAVEHLLVQMGLWQEILNRYGMEAESGEPAR